MDPKRLAAHAALQTLYTLHGVDNPLITPVMQRQVEARSEQLSRRGFLGLMGAGTAGLMAGAVFDPATKLWTPTAGPIVEATPGQILRVDGALQELARLFALALDEKVKAATGFWPTGWHGRGRERMSREDLDGGWMVSSPRVILHCKPEDATTWITAPDGRDKIGAIANRGRGYFEAPYFNERRPLLTSAVELDPTVRVADYLSPREGVLARVIQYDQPSGWKGEMQTWTDFEVAGLYRATK